MFVREGDFVTFERDRAKGSGVRWMRPRSSIEPDNDNGPQTWEVGSAPPALKRYRGPPGASLFGRVYPDATAAFEELKRSGHEHGVSFQLKRSRYSKKYETDTYYFLCSRNRAGVTHRCSAAFVAHYNRDAKECTFDRRKSKTTHSGHMLVPPVAPAAAAAAAVVIEEKFVASSSAEELRCLYTKGVPELLPQGLRGIPPSTDYPFRLQTLARDKQRFTLDKCTRNRVYHGVDYFDSPDTFADALDAEDVPYFRWWMGARNNSLETTSYLRVRGVQALELQLCMTYFQTQYGVLEHGATDSVASGRYAVFKGGLLVIDSHALRAYRLVTASLYVAVGSSMPVTPMLLQAWVQRPASGSEQSLRRLAIKTTLDYMYARISDFRVPVADSLGMFEVNDPGFEIYDWLPDYISLFHETDQDMSYHLIYSTAVVSHRDDTLYMWLAAFILQRELHVISALAVELTMMHFSLARKNGDTLRRKYPYAFAVLDRLSNINGFDALPVVMTSAKAWGKLPVPTQPPHYFLYQLCFETKLLSLEARRELASGMEVYMAYWDELPTGVKGKARNLAADVAKKFPRYERYFPRPSADLERLQLHPFSTASSDFVHLRSLYLVLNGMDTIRHNKVTPLYDKDLDPPVVLGNYSRVAETFLMLPDPLKCAVSPANLPVACKRQWDPALEGQDTLAYFEDSLWVWPVPTAAFDIVLPGGGGSVQDTVESLEAKILVRDARYYLELHHHLLSPPPPPQAT